MDWASAIFPFDRQHVRSDYIDHVWQTSSMSVDQFVSVAVPNWEIVFATESTGQTKMYVRGPESRASISEIPKDCEFWGIRFKPGTFLAGWTMTALVDRAITADSSDGKSVQIFDAARQIPKWEDAETFVSTLVRNEQLQRDPLVQQIMARAQTGLTERTEQRRFVKATGLTYGEVRQIERAAQAGALLEQGTAILDVVDRLGYSDQSHLTRATKRFLGMSPARIGKVRE